MPMQKALQAFRQKKHNCAQSIFRGFQESKRVTEDTIEVAKFLGGGRAPYGRCGALHAALELADGPLERELLTQSFVKKAGSEICREIKKHRKVTCEECVLLAAEELTRVLAI